MDAAALWIAAALNAALAAALIWHHRRRVATRRTHANKAEIAFGIQYLLLGLPATLGLFFMLIRLLDAHVGHGELLVGGAIGLVILALILMKVGAIVIHWKPMRW